MTSPRARHLHCVLLDPIPTEIEGCGLRDYFCILRRETHVGRELGISLHIDAIADHIALGGVERDRGRSCCITLRLAIAVFFVWKTRALAHAVRKQ